MRTFTVSSRGRDPVQVEGPNWLVALGEGLARYGAADGLARLACEVLPNGTVIARDISSGTGWVVQTLDDDGEEDPPEAQPRSPLEPHLVVLREATSVASACGAALTAAEQLVPGAESGAVILRERGYLRFLAVSGPAAAQLRGVRLPLDAGVAGVVVSTGRAVVVDDAREDRRHCGDVDALTGYQTQGLAAVPVGTEPTRGVLELLNRPGSFSREDLKQLGALGDALAGALERLTA